MSDGLLEKFFYAVMNNTDRFKVWLYLKTGGSLEDFSKPKAEIQIRKPTKDDKKGPVNDFV